MIDVSNSEMQAMKKIVDVCVGIENFTYAMQKNAPRPVGEYAAIKCTSSLNPGFDESRMEVRAGKNCYVTRGVRVLTFQIIFSRDGSDFIKFDNSFFRPDVQQVLKKFKFAAMGKTTLDLASLTLETNWEARHAVKMQFNVLREDVMELGTMSDARIDGKFIDGDKVITKQGI